MTLDKLSNKLYLFLLLAISILLFYSNYQQREYGWDMPGYLGSYYLVENPTNNLEIQENVYSLIKSEAPKFQYDKMVGFHVKGNWNDWISKNGAAFNLQIPYYSIKVFYVFLIFCFHKVGFSLPIAAFLPNIISFFIFGFLLFYILKEILKGKKLIPFILTLVILLIPPFRYLATIPSPDMLTVLFLTWFAFSVLKKHKLYIQFMILILVIFSRPDFIIFDISYLGIYFLYDLYQKRKINWFAIIFGILMMATYFLILKINNYPGWKDVFYDSFIQRRRIITGNADFTFQEYWQIFIDNIVNFKKISLIAIVLFGVVCYFTKDLWVRSLAALFVINIYLKFAFFPAPGEYRFFIGFVLLLFITSVYAAKDKIRNLTR